jgi:hypothetical protein
MGRVRFSLPKFLSTKKHELAKINSSTYLHKDEYPIIQDLCNAEGVKESEALRLIVSDWIRRKRVEALGRDNSEDPIRKIYERVMEEQIAPLLLDIQAMKSSLDKLSSKSSTSEISTALQGQIPDQSSDILEAIKRLRSLLEQTGSDLSESCGSQMIQLEQINKSHQVSQAIGNETFASVWTVLDLVIRYVMEVNLLDQNKSPEELDFEIAAERQVLRLEGLKKIALVEKLFNLPDELRLAERVLAERTFSTSLTGYKSSHPY